MIDIRRENFFCLIRGYNLRWFLLGFPLCTVIRFAFKQTKEKQLHYHRHINVI
jgi:hypothetical protein